MELQIKQKFETYPEAVAPVLSQLREVILTVAKEECIDVSETIKWGEPSYIAKQGSTIRFDWKAKHPDQYALYFNCRSKLVETFKELYPNELVYEGNRAVLFRLDEAVPWPVLKHCISLSLRYHQIKHLPLLGA
ncbi:DUF1801 domain-containing protein [Marinomonas algicola]|jgi:hypothetical protein|uniref:DUF1801 domain-containing protein n=1 Tax=Marinomonas algicola TaxID=2773454 RepID=UPI00174B38C3|nr:DUF1801 domain-containing protein [Marinomonas algicola]